VVLATATLAFAAAVGLTRFGYTLIAPGMRAGLGLSATGIGSVASISLLSYLVCSLPAGALATRFGARRVVTSGLALAALGLAATSLAVDLPGAILPQMLAGGAVAAVIVPVLAVGSTWFPPHQWGRAGGVVVGGGGLGILGTGLLVPLFLGPDPVVGWRQAWLGLAGCVLLTAVVSGALLRDEPIARTVAGGPRPAARLVFRSLMVWRLGLIFLLYGLAYITYGAFFGLRLSQDAGLPTGEIARLWSLTGLAGMGGGLLAGLLSDRLGPRLTLCLLFALQGTSEALLGLGDALPWFAASAALYGLTVWAFAAVVSQACALVVGTALAPAAVSLAVVLMSVGQFSGPAIGGVLADAFGSYTPALLLAAAADLLGILGCLSLRIPSSAPAGPGLPRD
jgi:predicted MFS family arabinose efflux permease